MAQADLWDGFVTLYQLTKLTLFEKQMARRKSKKKATASNNNKKAMVKLGEIEPGDLCYFVSADNKIRWGEVLKVLVDNQPEPIIMMQCQTSWSFHVGIIRLASWEEKCLKGVKWDIKATMGKSD